MKQIYILILVLFCIRAGAQKQVYIPNAFTTNAALSTWSYSRSAQSDNFICFWGPVVGTDPTTHPDANLRFIPSAVLDTLERNYTKFVKEFHFCSDDTTNNLGKYKIIVVMNETWPAGGPTGWAFGGSYDNVIGAMWVHPAATRDGAALSHELTHSLQGQNNIDRNLTGGFRNESTGFFWETHANYMRAQMYPQLLKEDMPRWLATRSYHYSSTRHHYVAFNLLFTIQQLDSLGMVNRLWHESQANEHPLMTYRRLKGWSQSRFNDFMYEYAKREVAADYTVLGAGNIIRAERNRIRRDEPHYLWRQYTMLKKISDSSGRYIVPDDLAPQDYGINIIPLYTTCANRTVKIKFKGHTEANSSAGWRYGFVSVKGDGGSVRYSAVYSATEAEVAFRMNEDETNLYLVVLGAPSAHASYVWEAGFPKIKRFPYELTIQNAVPEGYQPAYRAEYKVNGHVHPNGGGWVSNSATVAPSVYVGPNAIVRGNANISGNVRIEDNAWVESAVVKDNVVISGNANIFFGSYSNNVTVTDNAILNHCTVSGNVTAKGNALEWGVTLGGEVVVGGDAEISTCSTTGVYLQTPHFNNGRTNCDAKGATDPSNIDINAPITQFTDAQMAILDPVNCIPFSTVDNLALSATPSTSYVSPWENLAAVNDGFTPVNSGDKSHGAYGNWNNPNSFQWVQYDWPSRHVLNRSEIYWFDDGGGVRVPTTAYMEYWNDTSWVKIADVPLVKDAFNAVPMGNIKASRIRVLMKNTTQSTGILEWRVWDSSYALPAEPYALLSFTGHRADGSNILQWEVAAEDSMDRYEVEYGTDSIHFIKVGTIEANSNHLHSYQFTHNSNSSTSYYRLRQVQATGEPIYSRIVKLSVVVENLAMSAASSTSYVSPWETLTAVNDGFTPSSSNDKSHGAYGNWYNPDSFQWVQYDWPATYVINKAEVYWFDDGGGVRVPTTAYLEYWNDTSWVRIGDVPLVKDAFNTVNIGNIRTSRIRLSMKNATESTGILEWRVWGYASLPAADKLSVFHKDGGSGQLTDNTIRPWLQVNNESDDAVPYKDITIRYWLTAEDFSAMTNLYVDYAQLGSNKVKMKYVKLAQPHEGAYGYVEYSFDSTAGNLKGKGNSGSIQSRIAKNDWTNFNENNDYSYVNNAGYLKNSMITIYQNQVLVGGKEPEVITKQQSLKAYTKDASSGASANTISNHFKLINEGNIPVSYADVTVRYWFTSEGNTNLNFYLDYAKLGNSYVKGKFVKPAAALAGADTYLELSFTGPDSLYPLSNSGIIQQRTAKSDWSYFNLLNDHSYKAGNIISENENVTVYVKGALVYGKEPEGLDAVAVAGNNYYGNEQQKAGKLLSEQEAKNFEVVVTNNPLPGNEVEMIIRGAQGENLQLDLVDAAGRILNSRRVSVAGVVERQRLSVGNSAQQLFFLRISSSKAVKVIEIMKAR